MNVYSDQSLCWPEKCQSTYIHSVKYHYENNDFQTVLVILGIPMPRCD